MCVKSVMCSSSRVKLTILFLINTSVTSFRTMALFNPVFLCLVLQITDFGLSRVARSVSKGAREKDEDEGGTLSYMPPEALQDVNYKASRASDVYRYNHTHVFMC